MGRFFATLVGGEDLIPDPWWLESSGIVWKVRAMFSDYSKVIQYLHTWV